MLRWLYIQLIWLHPAPFRWRFGDDMLDDFDRAPSGAKLRYLADAVAFERGKRIHTADEYMAAIAAQRVGGTLFSCARACVMRRSAVVQPNRADEAGSRTLRPFAVIA